MEASTSFLPARVEVGTVGLIVKSEWSVVGLVFSLTGTAPAFLDIPWMDPASAP